MLFSRSEFNYNVVHMLYSLSGRTDSYILKNIKVHIGDIRMRDFMSIQLGSGYILYMVIKLNVV